MSEYQNMWNDDYRELVDRNIGFLTEEQQEQLRQTKVAVFGIGGIGGVAFEVLVRCGIGTFSIVDRDSFEGTNLNRQVFAFRDTLGRMKIDVAKEWACKINPDVEVETFDHVSPENISQILERADVAVMGIDSLAPCIIASRAAREMKIPLVEGWALPYGNVRVFMESGPTLEEAYHLPTKGRPLSDITDGEYLDLGRTLMANLTRMPGVGEYYSDTVVEQVRSGRATSFAPIVWLNSVLLALEAIKVLLRWGRLALAPEFCFYDPFKHSVPVGTCYPTPKNGR